MSAYLEALARDTALLRERAEALKASGREDEAALCRIEMNIDDIARTLYNVCKQRAEDGRFAALYLAQLDRLAREWQAARETALAHGDACRAAIEDVKLAALARCREAFLRLEQEG